MSGKVEKTVPADDATLGFAALLRQMFKDLEEASFDRVRKALARAAHLSGAQQTSDTLTKWKSAHQTLRRQHLRSLLYKMAIAVGYEPNDGEDGGRRAGTVEEITPAELRSYEQMLWTSPMKKAAYLPG
jgi:hypothetical protein